MTAVLISGGIDSAVLLAEALFDGFVYPLYVRTGISWEQVELQHLKRFMDAIPQPGLGALTILDLPVTDLYGHHWSLTGENVPDQDTPDEAVYLPGRNVVLLAKALLWCHLHQADRLGLGILGHNPFPDATPEFLDGYAAVVNQAVNGKVAVWRPSARLTKDEVIRRGGHLPLELTFSCIRPTAKGQHCGVCNKCAERRRAFASAGVADLTPYEERSCTR